MIEAYLMECKTCGKWSTFPYFQEDSPDGRDDARAALRSLPCCEDQAIAVSVANEAVDKMDPALYRYVGLAGLKPRPLTFIPLPPMEAR